MRNLWYPQKKAEFMTTTRFRELGMKPADVSERDHLLGSFTTYQDPAAATPQTDAGGEEAPTVKFRHLTVGTRPVVSHSVYSVADRIARPNVPMHYSTA